MSVKIFLDRAQFSAEPKVIAETAEFTVSIFKYGTGIESLILENSRGYVELLPYMGQILWAAEFDGVDLRMTNMFSQPQPAKQIVDNYGCFSFHSGLLSGGCPSSEDTHPLHGEFPCADMQEAWVEISEGAVTAYSLYEYVQGFGHHYEAVPSVKLNAGSALFEIDMRVSNLSNYQPMPLQYMCHMNYAFVPGGRMSSNLPDDAFKLRRTIPAHVKPTPEWTKLNEDILSGAFNANSLEGAEAFDPEIVYFADDLPQYGENAEFELTSPEGVTFYTAFKTADFPVATRWILHNEDQKVAAFVLPGTSRPEGYKAAEACGMLIWLPAGESKHFSVTTGIKG
ncbi:aldose 1-epimerase family protein [Gleimia sp. 6138-11-ORH1]|uniref:aldose 1-epimerase family protein n=1 Tax=Gleimia sp. 6138-11-ORH1 TaxID=2973937 RepID=UPI0021682D2F|nr:aldose 1-epimerase family protein [Gleimia sp. 6138-11-ORH1]MCS4483925.1 aldose 1-epimerase family protein [Gleimia sp. 6138-11-ORH1]